MLLNVVLYVVFIGRFSLSLRLPSRNTAPIAFTLYNETDPLVQFTSVNFDTVLNSPKAYFVEFYASWCGHCQKFAPTWVEFANDTKNWRNVVEIAVINCALEENIPICNLCNVHGYPTIKYFPRNAKSYSDALDVKKSSRNGIYDIRHALVDHIIDEYKTNRYENWPNFMHLADTFNLEELWTLLPQNDTYDFLGLIFEYEFDNYTGTEVILDLSPYSWIKTRRVKSTNPLTLTVGVTDFPALVLVKRKENKPFYKSQLRKALIGSVLSLKNITNSQQLVSNIIASTTMAPILTSTANIEKLKSKFYVSENDLLLSIHYALFNEVPNRVEIFNQTTYNALKDFMNLLRKYYPPISPAVKDALDLFGVNIPPNLKRSLNAKRIFGALYYYLKERQNETVNTKDWKEKMLQLEEQYGYPFPTDGVWQHCRGSQSHLRGYPCGLWTNFHTLTVNAFFEDGFKNSFDPVEILKAIKTYVENFFGCTECASHFVEMTTRSFNIDEFVKKPTDVVLYLWQAHNIVNHRLAGDVTEDPEMPKRQFPSEFLCAECRESNGKWNQSAVLLFLTRYYANIKPMAELKLF